jgi:hypothetical protein
VHSRSRGARKDARKGSRRWFRGSHIVIPEVGQECGSVRQESLELFIADIVGIDKRLPVSRTGPIELEYEVENCL